MGAVHRFSRRPHDELDLSDLDRVLAQPPTLDADEVRALRSVLLYLDGGAVPPALLGAVLRLRRVIERAPE